MIATRWLGRLSFAEGLRLQEELVRDHATSGDVLLLLEHDAVYTTGRGGRDENLLDLAEGDGEAAVVRIGRGGDATYHGPGQLVGYPIVDLRARGGDVHRYLRGLEVGLMRVLADFGLEGRMVPGRTGVWTGAPDVPRKIASIGIGVRRGISLHGFALNVSVDLGAFARIVPCGIAGVTMTSMAAEGLDPVPALADVAAVAARRVPEAIEECSAIRVPREARAAR
jgi:lipoate-protein ligase B